MNKITRWMVSMLVLAVVLGYSNGAIAKTNQTITFGTLNNKILSEVPFPVSATASSGLTVSFTSTTTTVCTVSGTTVTLVSVGTCTIAANQAGNTTYNAATQVTQSFSVKLFPCTPPSNIPSGLTVSCQCDTFERTNLSPSPMFGGAYGWTVSSSDSTGILPYINSTTGLLRLTANTGDNAKAATAPGIYPAAGNYVSVEFNHYAYNGSGADGLAVTLSDSSIPAVPGGYGGSQGYAPEGTPGFAGGWLGVALDEYGNYSNPTEGRNGGTGFTPEEVGMRGPGSGTNGYYWINGTASDPGGLSIDNHTSTIPAPGYMYQVIVDARSETAGSVLVAVNRDSTTMDGTNYANVLPSYNIYPAASNAVTQGWISQVVPNYWQVSFTSSTGGSTNIHEIGNLRICAQSQYPPTGEAASGFSAIDSAYPVTAPATVPKYPYFQTGDIYMKLSGTPFQLWIAALTSSGLSTGYSATTNKYVQVNLVPNVGSACQPSTCSAACTGQAPVETGGSQIVSFLTSNTTGAVLSSAFTLNSAYQNLVAVMKECLNSACTSYTSTAPACSSDSFSVRPRSITLTSASNNVGTSGGTSGTTMLRAGNDPFTVTATTQGVTGHPINYTGTPTINNASVQALSPSTTTGTVATVSSFSPSTSGSPNSTAISSATFTYSEVGAVSLLGPTTTTPAFVDDETWTSVDSVSTKNDCDIGSMANGTYLLSYSNTIDSNGKYGCYVGTLASTSIGRFTPDHFITVVTPGIPCPSGMTTCTPTIGFTYSGQPFTTSVKAENYGNAITQNYNFNTLTNSGYSQTVTLYAFDEATGTIANPGPGTLTNATIPATAFASGVASLSTPAYSFNTVQTTPTTIRIRAIDGDNISSLVSAPQTTVEGQTLIESGRTEIVNAYGSPSVPLPIKAWLQYWNGTSWVLSTFDQTTSFNTAISPTGNILASVPTGIPTQSLTSVSVLSPLVTNFVGGVRVFTLAAPNATGSMNLNINTPSYLPSVLGRATFGVYPGSPAVIYLREIY